MGVEQTEGLEKKTEHEVMKFLYNFLLSKRYLIVLDDIWTTTAWDMIKDAFPDVNNGSRIILTTRNMAVGQYPNVRKEMHTPKLLNEEESTRLLLSRAIPEYMLDNCNNSHAAVTVRRNIDKLMELGKDLAVKCCGLPLALVVLGGYLSRNLDSSEWTRLTGNMDWHAMISGEKVVGSVMDLSYYDMPSNLRSCFMYATAFPEDSNIPVNVLTSLWIAEGFIPLERGHSKEEVALKYVAELIQRCMIQVSEKAASGRVVSIRVHDILRDWGIGRARREGFLKDCHVAQDVEVAYSEETMESYRVAFHITKEEEIRTSSTVQRRSLLYFNYLFECNLSTTKALIQHFHHLRVLYMHEEHVMLLPREISLMRYLRYLGLGGSGIYFLPSSIGDLLSLETFYAPDCEVHGIPSSLWKIPTLRQVYVPRCQNWSVSRRVSSLSKVQMVVGFVTSDDSKNKQMIEATKLQISKNKNPTFSFCCIAWYRQWIQLEIAGRYGEGVCFPNNLEHITNGYILRLLKICCVNLLSNDQDILELARPGLYVLEIGERSYTGSVMICPSGGFQDLEHLVLHNLVVEDWKIEHGSMEDLRVLTLCKCTNLTQLPEGLLLLPNLVKVELIAMPPDCYQQGTVIQELKKKGCTVSISSDEKNFKPLNLPLPYQCFDDYMESVLK